MRRPIVVANWKMYTSCADAHILATSVRNGVAKIEGLEVVLCPPFVWLSELRKIVGKGGRVELGAQNMFFEPEGAYTGEISPLMLKELVQYVILGHSERREFFGEKDFDVNEKVIAALRAGIRPIICVGESKKEKLPRKPLDQLKEALEKVPKKYLKEIVVAYEPIWAIGTGENAEPEYVARVLTYLRELGLRHTPMLYGGSVNSSNAAQYAQYPGIDGLLVGGASLRAAEFVKICGAWSQAKDLR